MKVWSVAVGNINPLQKASRDAENERLNKEVDRLSQCVMYHDGHIVDAKSEAYKEFAERLHQKCAIDRGFAVMPDDAIEITYKELTEGGNEDGTNHS